jgi:hypothetical protein
MAGLHTNEEAPQPAGPPEVPDESRISDESRGCFRRGRNYRMSHGMIRPRNSAEGKNSAMEQGRNARAPSRSVTALSKSVTALSKSVTAPSTGASRKSGLSSSSDPWSAVKPRSRRVRIHSSRGRSCPASSRRTMLMHHSPSQGDDPSESCAPREARGGKSSLRFHARWSAPTRMNAGLRRYWYCARRTVCLAPDCRES